MASFETTGWVQFLPHDQPGACYPLTTPILLAPDTELHLRQSEYCTYSSVRSLCISWNIDASVPQDLSGSAANYEFLQQALTSADSPDIISFGFQEMVRFYEYLRLTKSAQTLTSPSQIDLESKKLTASCASFH